MTPDILDPESKSYLQMIMSITYRTEVEKQIWEVFSDDNDWNTTFLFFYAVEQEASIYYVFDLLYYIDIILFLHIFCSS